MIQSHMQVNAKGLACPLPIVKTKKAMQNLQDGQVLEIQATDKGSIADLVAWSKSVGHQYIGSFEKQDVFYHFIRKSDLNDLGVQKKQFLKTSSIEEALVADGIIIDVRESAEYAFGHIAQAISIPLGELENHLTQLDANKVIYLICRTGIRSDLAAQQLQRAGFTKLYNVLPGMSEYTGELKKEVH